MDLDLFSAFDGSETVDEVQPVDAGAAAPVLPASAQKRAAAAAGSADDAAEPASRRARHHDAAPPPAAADEGGAGGSAVLSALATIRLTEPARRTLPNGRTITTCAAFPADYVAPTDAERDACAARPPAKSYPFELDPFQSEAIACVEREESVLVAAHTSAGKTVCAEYAIAKCLRDKRRVVYTSPIKALSNQKFRDMQEEFGDVGLMTGDVTINADATCVIIIDDPSRSGG